MFVKVTVDSFENPAPYPIKKLLQSNKTMLKLSLDHPEIQLQIQLRKQFKYVSKPHIVCLCETWLKSTREPSFINYNVFFLNIMMAICAGVV